MRKIGELQNQDVAAQQDTTASQSSESTRTRAAVLNMCEYSCFFLVLVIKLTIIYSVCISQI